jgi:hypothetical protein
MPDKLRIGGLNRTLRGLVLLVYAAMPAAAAYADDIKWDFSGFGTVAGVKTDEDIAQYRLDIRQGEGATSDDIDWGLLSRLGAQLTVDFGEQFSLTAQAVAQRRGQDDMDPELEWLYASYQPASWLDVRVGRLVLPILMASDYRSVGYAQPTVSPPPLTYIWTGTPSFEGIQLLNRFSLGSGSLSIQFSAGEGDEVFWTDSTSPVSFGPFVIPPDSRLKFDNLYALNVMYEWGDWLLRGARLEADYTIEDVPLPVPPSSITYNTYGLQYDNGRLLIIAENFDISDLATTQYILLGWRFGKWLPSITFSESEVVDVVTQQKIDSNSTMFALRYDVIKNAAIKLQWEKVPAGFTNQTPSPWLDEYPGFDGDREVISFGLDFIF